MPETVHIGELRLRAPASGPAQGQRLANAVAERLGPTFTGVTPRRLDSLSVRVEQPPNTTEAGMSEAIANAIRRAVERSRHG